MRADFEIQLTEEEYGNFIELARTGGVEVLNETIRKSYDFKSGELTEVEHLGVLQRGRDKHRYVLRHSIGLPRSRWMAQIDYENQDHEIPADEDSISAALSGPFSWRRERDLRYAEAQVNAKKTRRSITFGFMAMKLFIFSLFSFFLLGLYTFVRWIV